MASHEKLDRKKQDSDRKKREFWKKNGRGRREKKRDGTKMRGRGKETEAGGKPAGLFWKKMRIQRETLQRMRKPVLAERDSQ